MTDARGNSATTCYNHDYTGQPSLAGYNNVTRRIESPPTSGANPLVTLSTYDAKNNLVETVSPKGVSNGAEVTSETELRGSVNYAYGTDYSYDAGGVFL